jgi:hypothetical protein
LGNLFFTAGVGEVDPALFDAIQNRADQMRKAERSRHVGVELEGSLPEVVEVFVGEDEGLQLGRRAASSSFHRWHQVHGRKNCSD